MIALTILLIAGILTVPAVLLMTFAKSGEQETLGGVILLWAAVTWIIGGFVWSLGL